MALSPCNECQKPISTDAKTCPNCGKRKPHLKSVTPRQVFISLFLFFGFMAWIASQPHSPSSSPPHSEQAQIDTESILTCQDHIKAMAKYPSSVEFPWGGFQTGKDKSGNFVIQQNFTAMNGFGAKLPHQGTCRFQKNGKIKVTLTER